MRRRLFFPERFGVWVGSFCGLFLLPLLLGQTSSGTGPVTVSRGDALFRGREELTGRIRGQQDTLPPDTVRCVNCHGTQSSSGLAGKPAPRLDRQFLTSIEPRRGGPPSRYSPAAFCRLLRTGSDPATIVIAREMPVYDVSDDQCASLWAYILERDGAR